MNKEILTYKGVIYPWHCDFNNHMNVQFYTGRFDEATWHFFSQVGITKDSLQQSNKALVAAEQHFMYYKEVFSGDLIEIHSTLDELKSKAITFTHKMIHSESKEKLAEAKMVGVCIDKTNRKPVEFPPFQVKKL